jgi:hypothetical protein
MIKMHVCHTVHIIMAKSVQIKQVHQALVLCPSCDSEKVGINQHGINQVWYSHKK